MGIFSCILHRRILGTLAGRHKNSRAAISPAFAAGRAHGRRGAAGAVILKGEFHSDAVRGAAAPERLGAGTCRCGVNGWPAQERPGNGETPGNIGRLWAAGRPIFAPETVSALFWHFMPWKWCGPRKTPLRAPESLQPLRYGWVGPEMSPPRHPPSAGPARSRTLQPLGERGNRTCGQSCSVRRRPLCDSWEAPGGPAGPAPGAGGVDNPGRAAVPARGSFAIANPGS